MKLKTKILRSPKSISLGQEASNYELEIQKITLWWMQKEGLCLSEARRIAIEEFDFYYNKENDFYGGADERIQEYQFI